MKDCDDKDRIGSDREDDTASALSQGQDDMSSPASPNPASQTAPQPNTEQPENELRQSLWRGWRRKCPQCGSGPMLKGYLKVRDHCPVCREELHHHRADDGPAYLTILIVGHLMAPSMLIVFTSLRPDPLIMFTSFAIGTVTLSLYLLPRLKGALVGFQWARRMHGFGRNRDTTP